jgi:hypothetical protein
MEVKKLIKFSFIIFKPRRWKKGQTIPLEKVSLFFGFHFSCERYGQSTSKFDMDLEVLCIYRLVPRKFDLLGQVGAFGTIPASRFGGLLVALTAAYSIPIACFWVSVNRYALYSDACEIGRWVVHLGFEK